MLDSAVRSARGAAADFLNSRDRSAGHVALGAAIFVGAAVLSTALGARAAPEASDHESHAVDRPSAERPGKGANLLWPALFSMLTWSGLRVWNAADSPERRRALGVWGAMQAVNTLWLALAPKSRLGQILTSVTTLGLTAAYVSQARKVDGKAAAMAAPYAGAGWTSFSGAVLREFSRLNRPRNVTLH